jgi:ubiquinone/menaquinone biosynthesis C-methylase UbiE
MSEPQATYTHGHHDSVLRSHRWRTAANSAGYLLPHLSPGQRLLDVGCGPGTITADFARLVAPGTVTALEHTADALSLAKAEFDRRGVANAVFDVADVLDLPYPDGTFDVVHAHQVLQHLADPVRALREMRRVCRPGGLVAVRDGDYAAMTWYPAVPGLDAWNDLYHRVARANGGEPDAGRRLLAWARAAGFAEADLTPGAGIWCYAGAEDRAWWSESWANRITESAIARQAVTGGHATEDELAAIAGAWREWGADPDAWFAVPHGELLCRV